jgi:protein-S-isoprenylcysteine O-methyltransferase Ste14
MWLRQSVSLPLFFVLLFAPAGTLDYWQGWLYGILFAATAFAIGVYFFKNNPQALARRMKVGPFAEERPAQKIIISFVFVGFLLLIAMPGLDHRWRWSEVPVWLALSANVLVVLGLLGTARVVKQNSYAASTITVEAGQPVVSTGLYGIVRHPMYSSALLMIVFTPLALGSYWTMLLIVPLVGVLAWRILDEEQYLTRHLPGYDAYCRRVHYRLVPGVW